MNKIIHRHFYQHFIHLIFKYISAIISLLIHTCLNIHDSHIKNKAYLKYTCIVE